MKIEVKVNGRWKVVNGWPEAYRTKIGDLLAWVENNCGGPGLPVRITWL